MPHAPAICTMLIFTKKKTQSAVLNRDYLSTFISLSWLVKILKILYFSRFVDNIHGWQMAHLLACKISSWLLCPFSLFTTFPFLPNSSDSCSLQHSLNVLMSFLLHSWYTGSAALICQRCLAATQSQNPEFTVYEADHVHNIVFEICHFSSVIAEVPTPI